MGKIQCCDVEGLRKGAWTAEEDKKLLAYIQEHGEGGWRSLPQKAGILILLFGQVHAKFYWNNNLVKMMQTTYMVRNMLKAL